MKKETFHKKWYFRFLQIIFFGSIIFISGTLILLGFYEDDMPIVAFIYAGLIIFIYWLSKRIYYHFMFGDKILPRKI